MTRSELDEIFSTYKKYSWHLRRLLSTPASREMIAAAAPATPMAEADFDAAWFSRSPNNGAVAWEIRYLGEPAFALLESLDETDPDFESALAAVEKRMLAAISSKA